LVPPAHGTPTVKQWSFDVRMGNHARLPHAYDPERRTAKKSLGLRSQSWQESYGSYPASQDNRDLIWKIIHSQLSVRPRHAATLEFLSAIGLSDTASTGRWGESDRIEVPARQASGRSVEVDVVVEGTLGGVVLVIGVECTSGNRKATVEWVDQMLGRHNDPKTEIGIGQKAQKDLVGRAGRGYNGCATTHFL